MHIGGSEDPDEIVKAAVSAWLFFGLLWFVETAAILKSAGILHRLQSGNIEWPDAVLAMILPSLGWVLHILHGVGAAVNAWLISRDVFSKNKPEELRRRADKVFATVVVVSWVAVWATVAVVVIKNPA